MMPRLRFGFLLIAISLLVGPSLMSLSLSPDQILNLLNQDRLSHGLDQLSLSPTLTLAALAKADDMISKNYFSHVAPDGTSPWHWFKSLGYNYAYAGENLAVGFTDPADLENSWMASPSHRANILSPFYSDVGVAVINRNNTNIIVQFFGSTDNKVTLRQ